MPNQESINRAVRHRILLEQYSNNEIKKAQKVLKRVSNDLVARLSKEGVTIENTKRYNALLKDVRALMNVEYGAIGETLAANMVDLSETEAEFAVKSLKLDLRTTVQTVLPTAEQLHVAVFARPLEGQFMEPFIRGWRKAEVNRVTEAITTGFYRGTPTQSIAREIRGTRANQFKDGIIGGITNRHTVSMVRTAITHTSAQSRMAAMMVNSDIVKGWRFVNVLDDRTSIICSSQDTVKVYPLGQGPIPPLHHGCRSTMIYVPRDEFNLKPARGTTRASVGASGPKPVPASQTYSTWLKNQPAAFQDQALGKTRGALFRRGGLSVQKFTTNTNQVLTLPELRKAYPLAFEKANIK